MNHNTTQKALWSGRFAASPTEKMQQFSQSLDVDWQFYREDIAGSRAHGAMLYHVGLLTAEEQKAIDKALFEIEQEIEAGTLVPQVSLEDVHMNIEARLIEKLGPMGAKIHTGRSRNDQVATDYRLFMKKRIAELLEGQKMLLEALANRADEVVGTSTIEVRPPEEEPGDDDDDGEPGDPDDGDAPGDDDDDDDPGDDHDDEPGEPGDDDDPEDPADVTRVTGVTLDRRTLTLEEGETRRLIASVTPSQATNQSVSWSSSNESVAWVSSTGLVTARRNGRATITVTTADGSYRATCEVTVLRWYDDWYRDDRSTSSRETGSNAGTTAPAPSTGVPGASLYSDQTTYRHFILPSFSSDQGYFTVTAPADLGRNQLLQVPFGAQRFSSFSIDGETLEALKQNQNNLLLMEGRLGVLVEPQALNGSQNVRITVEKTDEGYEIHANPKGAVSLLFSPAAGESPRGRSVERQDADGNWWPVPPTRLNQDGGVTVFMEADGLYRFQ